MVNKQTSISQRLFTDLKHARVQLRGGPPALINLRISVPFSRCRWQVDLSEETSFSRT